MVNAIKKRVEKSRERNPLWIAKNKNNTDDKSPGIKRKNSDNILPEKKRRKNISDNLTTNQINKNFQRPVKNSRLNNTNGDDYVRSYSGVESKPGERKIRSKFNLKSQAILHRQNLKKELKTKKTRAKIQVQRNADRIARKERVRVRFNLFMYFFFFVSSRFPKSINNFFFFLFLFLFTAKAGIEKSEQGRSKLQQTG